jgi:hypothetical protein
MVGLPLGLNIWRLIGFATTIAEPALIAVAYKAYLVSGGTISQLGLRLNDASLK